MSFLREKQSRSFFYCNLCFCILLFLFHCVILREQTQTAKEMLLSHDATIASYLLEQGVSSEIVVQAIANTKDDGRGLQLLTQIGYTQKTPAYYLQSVAGFRNRAMLYMLTGSVLFISMLLSLCTVFLIKREQLYHKAVLIIRQFSEGDFTVKLPRTQDGTIYQLFALVDNLAATLRSKGEIESKAKEFMKQTISDISHQLKTPLAALFMYYEIIADEPDNPAIVTKFSGKTLKALERMERLIQSLLKITRLDAGSITFNKGTYPITQVVAQAIEELTTRVAYEQKRIIVDGQKEAQITCDLQWTSEALGNIVKNALEHTSSGGCIHIFLECSPAMVRFSISDDGSGINQEDIHHIFKRFYRSHDSSDTQGVGLGLPLAKAIIEGQGGIISVQSTPGIGTTFIISFLTDL